MFSTIAFYLILEVLLMRLKINAWHLDLDMDMNTPANNLQVNPFAQLMHVLNPRTKSLKLLGNLSMITVNLRRSSHR